MIKKLGAYSFIVFLFLSLTGCAGYVYHANEGQNYIKGQYDKAIGEFEKALLDNPQDPSWKAAILNGLGSSYMALDDFEKGTNYVLKSIEVYPDLGFAGYLNLAYFNYKKGRLKEAYVHSLGANKASISPRYVEIYLKRTGIDLEKFASVLSVN